MNRVQFPVNLRDWDNQVNWLIEKMGDRWWTEHNHFYFHNETDMILFILRFS